MTRVVNLRLLLSTGAALALALAIGGCSATTTPTIPPAAVTQAVEPSPAPVCAWYTPAIISGPGAGQLVIVAATGPGCKTQALIAWIAVHTGKPWAITRTTGGTAIAQLARSGTIVRIYQTGFAAATDQVAGYLADDLQAAGWTIQAPPPATSGPTPPPITTSEPQ
jgi:hypothetical protein